MHTLILLAMLSGLAPGATTIDVEGTNLEPLALRLNADAQAEALVRRVEGMSRTQQLATYFGAQSSISRWGSVSRAGSAYSLSRFTADPALRAFDDIRASWLVSHRAPRTGGRQSVASLVEAKVLVARNLFLQGQTQATEVGVAAQLERVERYRGRYAETPLFLGRTVVYAASDDKQPDGRQQFGRLANQVVMRRDASAFYFDRGDEWSSPNGSPFALKDLIARERNLTFVFEGHGRETAIKLGMGMSARRLAGWLAARPADFPPAIVILDACRSHDFARHLLDELARSRGGAALPILVVPDEYGQNLVKDIYRGAFLRQDLAATRDASIGSALRNGSRRLSIYVPDDQHQPLQIG